MANLIEKKINIFDITINPLTMDEAVESTVIWIKYAENDCKFIVTPNVNCVVLLSKNLGYRDAFKNAAMVVADGKPVVLAARILGEKIPGTVTGSDFVPAIFIYTSRRINLCIADIEQRVKECDPASLTGQAATM